MVVWFEDWQAESAKRIAIPSCEQPDMEKDFALKMGDGMHAVEAPPPGLLPIMVKLAALVLALLQPLLAYMPAT